MKSIMISIKPKYCELIASGKKTVEVRKTKPKIDVPFKCYIYATQPKKWFRFSSFGYASDESLWLSNGKVKMCDGFEFWADETEYKSLCGKVIGEFVCDRIDYWKHNWNEDVMHIEDMSKLSCVPVMDLMEYLDGIYDKNGNDKYLYAWHISNLVIYDKPKELGEFQPICKYNMDSECVYWDECKHKAITTDWGYVANMCNKKFTRPPQSWCYVEELGV